MTSNDAVADFVRRLGSDSKLLQDFKSDPNATLDKEESLSDEDKAILTDPDPVKIREAVSGQAIQPAGVVVVVVVAVIK